MITQKRLMNRCERCLIPDTRPDTAFDNGFCSACLAYDERPTINWTERKKELELLLERGKNHSGYDCIVPSSGGKDSTWQALTLIEMGARPLIVTATTCHLTPIGRANIDNLARYATTIEVTPNRTTRAKLNRLGLQLVGDISWPEHAAIFSVPFRIATELGIPLIFYGECPQNQYGGPPGTEQAKTMTRRWVTEFGGFLGLRPADFVGQHGITERDMRDYTLPPQEDMDRADVEAHFLGQYLPWDSDQNATVAIRHGMRVSLPSWANYWVAENLDNAQTGIHDHLCYRKFGYGRLAAQVSVDVRKGVLKREIALNMVRERDGLFPWTYAGVKIEDVMARLDMTGADVMKTLDKFTDWSLFDRVDNGRPILKEFA